MSACLQLARLLAAIALSAFLCACKRTSPPPTGIMIRIDAQEETKSELSAVRVRMFRKQDDTWQEVADERVPKDAIPAWPVEIPVIADGDLERTLEIHALALGSQGETIVQTRALCTYVQGKQMSVPLLLEDDCRHRACETEDCHGETCKVCIQGICREGAVLLPVAYSPSQSVEDAWHEFTAQLKEVVDRGETISSETDAGSFSDATTNGVTCPPGIFGQSRFNEACFQ